MSDLFSSDGEWLKGNLHLHTTESDGKVSPQEAVTIYAAHGYDFLAITDHQQVTETAELDAKGMVLIPGIELNGGQSELGSYHMVAIGADGPMSYEAEWSAQELIDYGNEHAEFVFMAHPNWLSLSGADFLGLEGLIGLEVYNTVCHYTVGRGESSAHWDYLLARGQRMYGFAVDDAHWDHPDACVAYIMVKAAERSAEGIIAAIKAGEFYSSNGPKIHNIERDAEKVRVECSPCWEVAAMCPLPGRGKDTYYLPEKPPFTEIEMELSEGTDPIRIECIDETGSKAWSNPIWLEE